MSQAPSVDAVEQPKVAYTRFNSLWVLEKNHELIIHENANIGKFNWSFDGRWLVYEVTPFDGKDTQPQIWLYDTLAKKTLKLKIDGHSPAWNPHDQTFAFLSDSILCVVEVKDGGPIIHQLTGGVSNFTWDGDGTNLLVSASASLFPDGWSHPRLYEVHWGLEKKKQELDVKVTPLHTISSPLKYEDLSILAIDVENFTWSNDGKSLAMTITPTASWSEDSNMLSVYVKENKLFIPLGEILNVPNWVKWAPNKPLLASIQGGGRLHGVVKNKVLTTNTIIPNYKKVHTPKGYADISFDWLNDEQIVVARGPESTEKAIKYRSSLYLVDLKEKEAVKLINTPKNASDSEPHTLNEGTKLAWIREDSDGKRHIWIGRSNGQDARLLVENVLEVNWSKELEK